MWAALFSDNLRTIISHNSAYDPIPMTENIQCHGLGVYAIKVILNEESGIVMPVISCFYGMLAKPTYRRKVCTGGTGN